MTQKQLLTVFEAASLLQMLTARVARLAKLGQIPCVLLPDGELRFDPSDLAAWIDRHKHGRAQPANPKGATA